MLESQNTIGVQTSTKVDVEDCVNERVKRAVWKRGVVGEPEEAVVPVR